MSLRKKTINSFIIMFSSKIIYLTIFLFVNATLARLLTPSQIGIMVTALLIVSFSEIFTQLGIGPALVQKEKISSSDYYSGLLFSVSTGLLLSTILFLTADSIGIMFNQSSLKNIIQILTPVFLLNSIGGVLESILQRDMKFKKIASINIISYVFYGVCAISLALAGYEVYSLVYATILQSFVKTLYLYTAANKHIIRDFKLESIKSMLSFGMGFSIGRIFSYFATQGDQIIVSRLLGVQSVGLYSRATQLMVLPTSLFGQVVDQVLFSAMAKKQNDKMNLKIIYTQILTIVIFVTIVLSVFLFSLSEELILLFYGSQWSDSISIFEILAVGMVFRTGYKISETVARSLGAVYKRAIIQAIYAFFILGGGLVASQYGLEAIAWSVTLAIFVNYLLSGWLANSLLGGNKLEFLKTNVKLLLLMLPFMCGSLILIPIFKVEGQIFLNITITAFVHFLFTTLSGLLISKMLNINYKKYITLSRR